MHPFLPVDCAMRPFHLNRWLFLILMAALPLFAIDGFVEFHRGRGVRALCIALAAAVAEGALIIERKRGRL